MFSHSHSHHDHDHTLRVNMGRVFWSLLLIGGFMIVEVIGGIISGSLALIADAAHMLVDTIALSLAWIAFKLSKKPADRTRTYGYHRFPVLVAFTNGISLIFIVGWIFIEAIGRINNPTAIIAEPMLAVAVVGVFVNIVAFALLHSAERESLNIRGAMLHVVSDLLGSVAAICAALVIIFTGWLPIDPILSVLVGLMILNSAWRLIKDAAHVLLEGVPEPLDVREISQDLVSNLSIVKDVHHVHAWSLSHGRYLLTLHARIDQLSNPDSAIAEIQSHLNQKFNISHATVQIELEQCPDEITTTLY